MTIFHSRVFTFIALCLAWAAGVTLVRLLLG